MNYKLNPKRKKIIADKILVLIFLPVCLAAGVLPVPDASAAEVFTKDQGLQGSVVGVTAEGVEFETIYGKGAIVIPWVDVKRIRSDKEFLILFAEADLPYGSKFRLGAEYLPEVSDWQGNYLIRTSADWTIPIIGWLDFKIAIFDTYNNRPPDDTDRNTFTTTAGLSFRF